MVCGEVLLARTTSSSFITLAGLKKCAPITLSGRVRDGGDLVDVERRRVGREDRAGLHHRVELAEDVLLDGHVLERGFDDDVAVGDRRRKPSVPVISDSARSIFCCVRLPRETEVA